MYTGKRYTTKQMAIWTRYETMLFALLILFWVTLYSIFDLHWLKIPWTPLALIGTAVAFVIGFQNNAAYGRIWEARKIWGGIVNTSRTFGTYVQDMVTNEHALEKVEDIVLKKEIKTLTYRHIAWLTALRHAMRESRQWESSSSHKTNTEWGIFPPEIDSSLEEDLSPYLDEEDKSYVLSKGNKQTAILYRQSKHLRELKESGLIWEFSFLELEALVQELYNLQGKSERIKNFPYPRQYSTLNHYFMWVFILLLPFALIPQFADLGKDVILNYPDFGRFFMWLAVPFYIIVAWIFHTMERIGRTGENPFEGTANDVPISNIARGIEIDLRQNLGESDEIPKPYEIKYNTQF